MKSNPPKKSYKDLNGTTRVGDFLRSIGKSKVLGKVIGVAGEVLTGDIMSAVKLITKSEELTLEQKEHALKLAELDLQEMIEVSKRWSSDMTSDSWLSKNVRPLIVTFLIVMTVVIIILESSLKSFVVDSGWIDLLKTLDASVVFAYFGSRGMEKFKMLSNKKII